MLEQTSNGLWQLATCTHDWLSIEAIPKENRHDEEGGLVIPESIAGHRILRVVDGEFLETDELIIRGEAKPFGAGEWSAPAQYCIDTRWAEAPGFAKAWRLLKSVVEQGADVGSPDSLP